MSWYQNGYVDFLTLSYRWQVTSSSHLEKEEMYVFLLNTLLECINEK